MERLENPGDKGHERFEAVAVGYQNDDGDGKRREVLLEFDVLVGSEDGVEFGGGLSQERTVAQAGPAHLRNRTNRGLGIDGGEGVRLRLPVEIRGPVVHQAAPALQEITARVGRLRRILYRVGERGLDHLAGCAGLFRGLVPEARPEPMRHGGDAEFLDQCR